ncbi:SGNH/GDSL hydrolase family protein [Novosphingobium sp.]|uniref:SGNH/GDSL hydrolase family protein n=1 Tax=Novosphingobium sp. TaxID=1874826 RepID=UPI002FDDB675
MGQLVQVAAGPLAIIDQNAAGDVRVLVGFNSAEAEKNTAEAVEAARILQAASDKSTLVLDGYAIVHQAGTETIGGTFTSTSTGALGAVRGVATPFEHETVLKWIKWTPRTSGSGAEAHFYRPNENGTYAFAFAIPLGTVAAGQINTEITVDVSGYGRQVFPGWIGAHFTASLGRISTIAEPCLKFVGDPSGGAIEFKVANERPAIQFIGDYDEQLGKGAVAKNIDALDARATQLELTEPTNGVWFGSRENTRRTIAGINDVMNGLADFEILLIGDSYFAGSGSGSGGVAQYNDAFRRSIPGLIARALRAAGVPVSYHSIWGCHNTQVAFPAYCPYATQGAGWVYGGQAFGLAISAPAWTTLGGAMFVSPPGGANGIFGYTPPDPVDRFKIGLPKRSDAGTLQWRVDGGAWHDLVQTASADAYDEVTITAADDGALAVAGLHTLELRRKDDTGWAGFAMLDAWDSTRKTVRIHNAGHAGALATTTLMTTPSPWSPLPRLIAQTAGLVIYNPATNDCREGKSPAELMAAQKLHLAYFKASGSDALLLSMAPQDPTAEVSFATLDQQAAFAATTKAVAKAGGAAFVDLLALFGSWAEANAAGKYTDYIHLNQAGYQMLVGAIMQLLGPIAADAVAALAAAPGAWQRLPAIYKLLIGGIGTVTIDKLALSGAVTAAAKTYTATGAKTPVYPFFGSDAQAIRAAVTGSATMEII